MQSRQRRKVQRSETPEVPGGTESRQHDVDQGKKDASCELAGSGGSRDAKKAHGNDHPASRGRKG